MKPPPLQRSPALLAAGLAALISASFPSPAVPATLTVTTTRQGASPHLLGYNIGHFFEGSNTQEWFRYSGARGARAFVGASVIQPTDDIPGHGDGVTSQATFLSRKAALRANPLSTTYIDWPDFENRFENATMTGTSKFRVNYAFSRLRELGVEILCNTSAKQNIFVINNDGDWAGKWELWQHYYAQAFYMAREFDVQRHQMFNEPNHPNANGLTQADYLRRLKLVSDAIQSAIADVNSMYGKSLEPLVFAPVNSGGADDYSWGGPVVDERHTDFLGVTDPNFWLIHRYDYHQYNSSPSGFGSDLIQLRANLNADMAPETRFVISISEFNVHTNSVFDTIPETLDTPSKYVRFGGIVAHLTKQFAKEFYAFKFSQTPNGASIKKNGMHYVHNDAAPYNIGGITKAGEVYRLFVKGFAPDRDRYSVTLGTGATHLDVQTAYDPVAEKYYIFSANDSSSVPLTVDLSAWNIPVGNRVLVEEVSEARSGGGKLWASVAGDQTVSGTQPANSVWLFTIPRKAQTAVQNLVATDDALVKDGSNKNTNYGAGTALWIKNHSTNPNARNASFIKFTLPVIYLPDIQLAILQVRANSINGAGTVQSHVYGIDDDTWSQGAITWSNAPNLADDMPPGTDIPDNYVEGVGDSARLLGQLVATSTQFNRTLDVTEFLRAHPHRDVSLLLAREIRFSGDNQDSDGLQLVSREGDLGNAPRLKIVRLPDGDGDGISDEAETGTFGTLPGIADTDGDGLSDGEEVLVTGTKPLVDDTDGDRQADGAEVLAGTDPLDPADFLRILSVQTSPTEIVLQWSSVAGKSYDLLWSTDMTTTNWSLHSTHSDSGGTAGTTVSRASVGNPDRVFFKVQVN